MTDKLRPMSEFDPSAPSLVQEILNERMIEWPGRNEDLKHFLLQAPMHSDGVIAYDGLLFDGWTNG
jgi:hypothetical protein